MENFELDFRAWCPKWDKMIYSKETNYSIHVLTNTVWDDCVCDQSAVMLQYTGRKTKEGKKMYEGDEVIVRGTKCKGEYKTTIVRSLENGGFTLAENKTDFKDDSCLISVIDVIGNIYED